jgi:7,8-dihydro-6-hydroxymethylpterin-pyrophosphokinase
MNTNVLLSKNDYIALIIEHIVMRGYSDSDKFVNFVTMVLPMMSTEELQNELESLEESAL